MGKTTLACNLVEKIARAGHGCLFLTLEMSSEQLTFRFISQMSGLSYDDVYEGSFPPDDYEKVMRATGQLSELPIFIDDTAAVTLAQIYSKVQRLRARHDIALIVIDYIQLMGSEEKNRNRVEEVGDFSTGLKNISKLLGIPVLAVAQLSRGVENTSSKRPELSSLRDSGRLEQDADVVLFIYRDSYYHSVEEIDDNENMESNVAEIIVSKNRFGATGEANLFYDIECNKFRRLVYEDL